MASAVERYQLYVSHVGDGTRSFLESLDAQPEEDVRAMLEQKEFGRRTHLVRIWMDFRKKMHQEADDNRYLHRINRAIAAGEQASEAQDADVVKAMLPPRKSMAAFTSRLKNFLLLRR